MVGGMIIPCRMRVRGWARRRVVERERNRLVKDLPNDKAKTVAFFFVFCRGDLYQGNERE